mmetsp:Transcript_104481/g.248610  ORF Transcript_104481/g.248610 Transcript_104481/m.248610 type:complete len:126 (+) Transcript_104481:58-435(+)
MMRAWSTILVVVVVAEPNRTSSNSTNLRGSSQACNIPTWSPCVATRCCSEGDLCYRKDQHYAQCQPSGSCKPGDWPDGSWTCQVLSPWDDCVDTNNNCDKFASEGECETNPEWMLWFCRRTCGQC